jgi:hypothetical protein
MRASSLFPCPPVLGAIFPPLPGQQQARIGETQHRAGPIGAKAMISDEELIALVGALYEAALDDDLWPKVLEQIADATGTVQAAIASADREANIVSVMAPRVDPVLLESWRDHWAYRDPFFLGAILRPPGEVYTLENVVAREEFTATEVFNTIWCKANCSLATAAANLIAQNLL